MHKPITLLQSTEEGGRGTEDKGKFPVEARSQTHFWICLAEGEQPPHPPQITPTPTAPFLECEI